MNVGNCNSRGFSHILTKKECEHAAATLGLPDYTAGTNDHRDNPYGCYFTRSSGQLYFGTAGNTNDDDTDRVSICSRNKCTRPSDTSGYIVSEAEDDPTMQFAVNATCAENFSGQATATVCASSGPYTLTGCTACPIGQSAPAGHNATCAVRCTRPSMVAGYSIYETDLQAGTAFAVNATCAANYIGSAATTACTSAGPYTLSGCSLCPSGQISDAGNGNTCVDAGTWRLSDFYWSSYLSQDHDRMQFFSSSFATELSGNTWRTTALPTNYVFTGGTTLSFDFKSNDLCEVHGIGFATTAFYHEHFLQLCGSQSMEHYYSDWETLPASEGCDDSGAWQRFELRLMDYWPNLQYYTQLVLINDCDIGTGHGIFRNFKVSQQASWWATKTVAESSTVQGATNTIMFVLQPSAVIAATGTITIAGLTGTQTADNGALPVGGANATVFGSAGAWTQNTGTLVLTVASSQSGPACVCKWTVDEANALGWTTLTGSNCFYTGTDVGQVCTDQSVAACTSREPCKLKDSVAAGSNTVVTISLINKASNQTAVTPTVAAAGSTSIAAAAMSTSVLGATPLGESEVT